MTDNSRSTYFSRLRAVRRFTVLACVSLFVVLTAHAYEDGKRGMIARRTDASKRRNTRQASPNSGKQKNQLAGRRESVTAEREAEIERRSSISQTQFDAAMKQLAVFNEARWSRDAELASNNTGFYPWWAPISKNIETVPFWNNGLPKTGVAWSLAVQPGNPLVILVGSTSGGIWRSSDAGATFSPAKFRENASAPAEENVAGRDVVVTFSTVTPSSTSTPPTAYGRDGVRPPEVARRRSNLGPNQWSKPLWN